MNGPLWVTSVVKPHNLTSLNAVDAVPNMRVADRSSADGEEVTRTLDAADTRTEEARGEASWSAACGGVGTQGRETFRAPLNKGIAERKNRRRAERDMAPSAQECSESDEG